MYTNSGQDGIKDCAHLSIVSTAHYYCYYYYSGSPWASNGCFANNQTLPPSLCSGIMFCPWANDSCMEEVQMTRFRAAHSKGDGLWEPSGLIPA